MKTISFSLSKAADLEPSALTQYQEQLGPEVERLRAARGTGYASAYGSINLPDDAALVARVKELVFEKQVYAPTVLVVIGIGGSSLGARAVHEALHGVYYNDQQPRIKIYFVETVDTDAVHDVLVLVRAALQRGEHILVNVISKSGSTTETIANYELFVQLLKERYLDTWYNYIVATTDEDSKLWQLATQQQIACLSVPPSVGGRYSVFSAVGLFPLAMLGVDIHVLRDGARAMVDACTQVRIQDNPAAMSAAVIVQQYRRGVRIHDMFLFSVELEAVGRWYRQLVGESLGKTSTSGERVGITPTVSVGSTDLHSVGQLYLGGPRDKLTTLVTVATDKITSVIPNYPEFENLIAHIQGKTLASVMDAIVRGVIIAYEREQLPYMLLQLPEKSAYYCAQLLQLKMIEIMYVGYLLSVNPFDQPHVEQYKVETRKILAHE